MGWVLIREKSSPSHKSVLALEKIHVRGGAIESKSFLARLLGWPLKTTSVYLRELAQLELVEFVEENSRKNLRPVKVCETAKGKKFVGLRH